MGYSCSQDAAHTLGVIQHMFRQGKSTNVLTIKGIEYFFERGRQQPDGAITGTLFRMLSDDRASKVGAFKINSDGMISKFPALSAGDRKEAEDTMRDMSARNPQLLRAWSMGRA